MEEIRNRKVSLRLLLVVLYVLLTSNLTVAQVNFQLGETWLEGIIIDRVSFSDDGKIYYIYNNHRSIAYYDLIDGEVDLTDLFNSSGLTYFIDFVSFESTLYIASNNGQVGILKDDELTLFVKVQEAGIDSITSIAKGGSTFYPSDYNGSFDSDLSIGSTDGLFYFSTTEDYNFRLATYNSLYSYEGTAFAYDDNISNVHSGYFYICSSSYVVSIFWISAVFTTTFSDSLRVLDLQTKQYSPYISQSPALYIGTDHGLIWKNWECNRGYDGHYLKNLRINDIQFFSPFKPLATYYKQQNYTFAGTSNGLYYSGDTNGPSDGRYTIVPNTSGFEFNDLTINQCAGEIYSATDNGIIQIKSFNNKSFIPYIADRISPSGEILFCQGDTIQMESGLNGNFDLQWFKDNDSIPNASTFRYSATEPGIYKFALYNCFFEDLQFSNELIVSLNEEVAYLWANPDTLKVCDSSDTLYIQTNSSNQVRWFRDGLILAENISKIPVAISGTYEAQITNCNGKVSLSPPTIVFYGYIPEPVIDFGDVAVCEGDTAVISISNYSTGNIDWFSKGELIDSLRNRTSFNTAVEADYHLRLSNSLCEVHSNILKLDKRDNPIFDVSGNNYFCEGSNTILSITTDFTNTIYLNNKLSKGPISISMETDLLIRVEDRFGCFTLDTINVSSKPLPTLKLPNDTTFCFGELILLSLNLNSEYSNYFVNEVGTDNHIIIESAGTYKILVIDSLGCTGMVDLLVMDACPLIQIPNVFTPNGDGLNDFFEIINLIPNCKLSIFTRTGNLIYHSNNYLNDWNGKQYPNGVYYYRLENRFYKEDIKGFIQILR